MWLKRTPALLLALCLPLVAIGALAMLGQTELAAQTLPAEGTAVHLTQESENGVSFRLETAVYHVSPDNHLQIAGLDAALSNPGVPALPYYTTFIALPPEAEVTIQVETGPIITRSAPDALAVTPEPEMAYANDDAESLFPGTPDASALAAWVLDPAYDAEDWYPTAVYQLSDPIYYRDLRLVQVTLYPLRYHASQGQIEQITDISVTLRFSGSDLSKIQPLSGDDASYQVIRQSVLNFEQGMTWRHLPQNLLELPGPGLPIGVDTYKIQVDSDGIYEISGAELAAAGMNLGQVDPATIEMMHRGQPVAYQFIGNPADGLQPDEAIRFFGAAFTGSRLETQFINDNVYWLWAGGNPTYVTQRANAAGQGQPTLASFRSAITREEDLIFNATLTNQWHTFPNEPDAWYWDDVRQSTNPAVTRNYAIVLPHPASDGDDPTYLVEMLSRESSTQPSNLQYVVHATINSYPVEGEITWQGMRNVNLTASQPITTLLNGANNVRLVFTSNPGARVYLNRISVEYERWLTADADQLFFTKQDAPGIQQFPVNNFSEGDPGQFLVWDVTDPLHPEQVTLDSGDIAGSGPYTVTFTSREGDNGRYLATTLANVQTVKQLSQYVPQNLEPAGGADWIAISHHLFKSEAQRLANHRAAPQFGSLATHVVDVEEVINQFGYGLPLPEALRHYLGYALANWSLAPNYVVLVGSGTYNPRNLQCFSTASPCDVWDANQPNFVLTDIQFVDRFQGAIPTDHTFVTLAGDDLIPDMAIGRLVVNTLGEAANVVSKIIQHDQNQLIPTEAQRRMLFVADSTDSGGNFCLENSNAGAKLPPSIPQDHLCITQPSISEADRVRGEMATQINQPDGGINILNYRGHGSVQFWVRNFPLFNVNQLSYLADPDSYAGQVYITTTTNFWHNANRPAIIISADCLDGNFAFPGRLALSQVFMVMPDVGTAAHWSSTGLGFTFEHTVLVDGLYAGAFAGGLTALGDAINHAKFVYHNAGLHPSELYSFLLQGDPAMQLYRPDLSLEKSSPQSSATIYPGDTATFHLTVQNNGIYASKIVLTDSLPAGLIYQAHSASQPVDLTISGSDLVFALEEPLAWGESASLTITAVVTNGVDGLLTNQAVVSSAGWDLNLADNQASAPLLVRDTDIRLTKSSPQSNLPVYAGDEAIFHLVIRNDGLSVNNGITLTDYLPPELQYQAYTASVPVTLTVNGQALQFALADPLASGDNAAITITTIIADEVVGLLTNSAIVRGEGGAEDEASASIFVLPPVYLNYLPITVKP